jgi:hypothetical protein
MTDGKIRIGMFGDSYISQASTWIKYLQESDTRYRIDVYGKGGANLYYAIHQWQAVTGDSSSQYDWVFFTLTWPERLFSVWPYRNEQFCARSELRIWEPDCSIQTEYNNQEFLKSIDLYYKYIHDQHWREFDYELEIKWVLDLPNQYPDTKFVIIPNTEQSRAIALRYHSQGILLDMAFETISNLEPNSPGPMPVRDNDRFAHLNDHNHRVFATIAQEIISGNEITSGSVLPIDLEKFNLKSHGQGI